MAERTMQAVFDEFESTDDVNEKMALAREAIGRLQAINPYEIRQQALQHARRERAKLELRAFLWSIPLGLAMTTACVALVRWLL